jgi:hypothetical protein
MSTERPPITEQHRSFPAEIVEVSQKISRFALRKITERFGEPPTEAGRDMLQFSAYLMLPFSYQGRHASSRSWSGRIGGSDYIVFNSLSVPDAAAEYMVETGSRDYAGELGGYRSRIIDMGLGYQPKDGDPYVKSFRLVTGPQIPLVLIDREIFSQQHVTAMEMERIGAGQLELPEDKSHYLEALELPPIREGLQLAAAGDLDIRGMLSYCHEGALAQRADQEAQWFAEKAALLPPPL